MIKRSAIAPVLQAIADSFFLLYGYGVFYGMILYGTACGGFVGNDPCVVPQGTPRIKLRTLRAEFLLPSPSSVAGATPSPSYGGRLPLVVRTRRNDTWVVPYKMGGGCTICPLRSLRSLHFYALWNLYTSCTRLFPVAFCVPCGVLCYIQPFLSGAGGASAGQATSWRVACRGVRIRSTASATKFCLL